MCVLFGASQWPVSYWVAMKRKELLRSSWFLSKGHGRGDEGGASARALVSNPVWPVPPGQESPVCPVPEVPVSEVWSPHQLEDLHGHKLRWAAPLDVLPVTVGIQQVPVGFVLVLWVFSHSHAISLPKGFLLFCLVLLDFPDTGP